MKILMMILLGVSLAFTAVDINTATKKELITLHGIASKKADTILAYRDTKCFKSINEIVNVKGIGPKTLAKNKANLTASTCKK
jgi:competence protein ComEA